MKPLFTGILTGAATLLVIAMAGAVLTDRVRRRAIGRLESGDTVPSPTAPERFTEHLHRIVPTAHAPTWWLHGRIVVGVAVLAALVTAPVPTLLGSAVAGAALLLSGMTRRGPSEATDTAVLAERLASSLASGADPTRLVIELLDDGDDTEVRRAIDDGEPLQTAIDRWARSADHPDRRLLADAWAVAGSTGAGIAPALLRTTRTLRDRTAVDREIVALTAQARLSARVLTIVPIGFAVLVAIVDHRVRDLLVGTTAGRLGIVVGLLLDWIGARWMHRQVEAAR